MWAIYRPEIEYSTMFRIALIRSFAGGIVVRYSVFMKFNRKLVSVLGLKKEKQNSRTINFG